MQGWRDGWVAAPGSEAPRLWDLETLALTLTQPLSGNEWVHLLPGAERSWFLYQFTDAQPSVPSECCGYWLDFHHVRHVTIQLSLVCLSPSCPKLVPLLLGGRISVLIHISEMHPFITAGCPGKEESPLPSRGEKIGCPHRVLPSLNLCSADHRLGQDEIKMLWETLCNTPLF